MKKIILLSALGLILSITGNTYADDDNLGGGSIKQCSFRDKCSNL